MIKKNPSFKSFLALLVSLLIGITTLCAQIKFIEITEEAGISHHYLGINEMGAGAAFFDMDNDGDEDLWLSGGLNLDALFENDGTGNFIDISQEAGLNRTRNKVTTGVITGDMDNDGFKDVLLITHIGFPNVLFRNNGDKTFEEVSGTGLESYKAYSLTAALGDVNQDGFLDIYAGHYIEKDKIVYNNPATRDSTTGFDHQCHANKLYLNNGDWTFTEVAEDWGVADKGCALATAFSDYDNDDDVDIIVANDFGAWVSPNALLENRGNENSFQDKSASTQMDLGIYAMGIAIGDYDNDLDLDYYFTNLGENILLQNQDNKTFINMTKAAGVANTYTPEGLLATGWGTAFKDFDNDSDLDLCVVNGYVPAATFIANSKANPNRLFENDGTGVFTSVASEVESPLRGRGLACADIDNDGDLDFLVGNVNRQATSDSIQTYQLYRNETNNGHNWLKIKLQGTMNNRDGLGSQVYLKAGERWYLQEANGGYGTHASQHSLILHFGLGKEAQVDSIKVRWLGGKEQIVTSVNANQLIIIEEERLVSTHSQVLDKAIKLKAFPNPFNQFVKIQYELRKKTEVNMHIFDQLGRTVFSHSAGTQAAGKYQLNWESIDKGIYFIRLQADKQFIYETIISN